MHLYTETKFRIEVYGSCSDTDTKRIQTIQNLLLKLILKLDRRTPMNTLHGNMRILKFSQLAGSVLAFGSDVWIGRCPEIFLDYYTLNPPRLMWELKGNL